MGCITDYKEWLSGTKHEVDSIFCKKENTITVGETSRQDFELPHEASDYEEIDINYRQEDRLLVTKHKQDLMLIGNRIYFYLDEDDTILFDYHRPVECQIKLLDMHKRVLASKVLYIEIVKSLDDKKLSDIKTRSINVAKIDVTGQRITAVECYPIYEGSTDLYTVEFNLDKSWNILSNVRFFFSNDRNEVEVVDKPIEKNDRLFTVQLPNSIISKFGKLYFGISYGAEEFLKPSGYSNSLRIRRSIVRELLSAPGVTRFEIMFGALSNLPGSIEDLVGFDTLDITTDEFNSGVDIHIYSGDRQALERQYCIVAIPNNYELGSWVVSGLDVFKLPFNEAKDIDGYNIYNLASKTYDVDRGGITYTIKSKGE